MMNNWKKYKLGEVVSIKYGKDHKNLNDGPYPVYGSGGIMRYVDNYLYDKESILIPRKGSLNNIFYRDNAFWTVDTMFWSEINTARVFPKFLYYQLSLVDFEKLNVGSAVPSLTIPIINDVDVSLPSLEEQKRIAGVLSSLDDKIDLLNRENATLEALAETLFRHYFIENPNPDWKEGNLGDVCHYVTDKMETSSLTTISYISTENMLNDKQGVTDASSIPDDIRVTRYGVGDILLSNIRPYFKKIWLADRRGGCSNDVLCIRANEKEFDCFVYYTLRQDDFFDYVMLGSKGCKMPRGDKQHIMNWPIYLPNVESLGVFNKPVYLMIQKIKSNQQQILTLTIQRDTLLPRLISGEVKVIGL